jgi:muramoyltetrapeptide carboxypeptidase
VKTRKIGIAIVAPSGYTLDEQALARGIERLESMGHTVYNFFDTAKVFQRFGGTDEARLSQLYAAVSHPEVQVVMALRGSYGLTRLLPQIDFAAMAASGKLFVGYSDFTAFQMALLAKAGAHSFAGPMLLSDFSPSDIDRFTVDDFFSCIGSGEHRVAQAVRGNPVLDVAGTLWGGNLAMVVSLLGTPYFPQVDDGILFLEDVSEHPYRVERMLLQLMQAGVLARQKAILLGDFSSYQLGKVDNGYDFEAMLAYVRSVSPVPVLTGLQFGHCRTRVTLPFGARARLRSDAAGFTLDLSAYPALADA